MKEMMGTLRFAVTFPGRSLLRVKKSPAEGTNSGFEALGH